MSKIIFTHIRGIPFTILLFGVILVSSVLNSPVSAYTDSENLQSLLAVANDDFDNALVVTGVPYTNAEDIISATVASDDPSFPCMSGQRYNTVWYTFSPAVSESLVFSTGGSQYSSILGVWTGTRGQLNQPGLLNSISGNPYGERRNNLLHRSCQEL